MLSPTFRISNSGSRTCCSTQLRCQQRSRIQYTLLIGVRIGTNSLELGGRGNLGNSQLLLNIVQADGTIVRGGQGNIDRGQVDTLEKRRQLLLNDFAQVDKNGLETTVVAIAFRLGIRVSSGVRI